jgi:hypothetical protein
VVVGQEDVRDPIDAKRIEVVEDIARAEVDEDRLALPAKQVHVDGVREPKHIVGDLHGIEVYRALLPKGDASRRAPADP